MRVDHADLLGIVLITQVLSEHALTAAALRTVSAARQTLDVAKVRHGHDHIVHRDQVLNIDFAVHNADLGAALIAVLVADLSQLLLDHAHQQIFVCQDRLQVSNRLLKLLILGQQLIRFQIGQTRQTHIKNSLRLLIAEIETIHKLDLGSRRVLAVADDMHDFVNIIQCLEQALQDMRAGQTLVQVILRTPRHDVFLMFHIPVQHFAQGEHLGLTVHKRQHDHTEGILQLSVLIQIIEDHLRLRVTLEINHDAHAVTVALIADIADTIQLLLMHQFSNLFNQLGLVDAVRNLSNDDAVTAVSQSLHFGLGTHQDAAAAGMIGLADAAAAKDNAACREVGALDMLHQIIQRSVRIIYEADDAVDDFGQVMRRNIGCHAHGNACSAVYE